MTCREFVEFVMGYLEEELGERERAVFEEHIEACPPCLTYLDTYRETVRLGRSVCGPDDEVPPDVPEELVRAILAARRRDPAR
jgi:predicted anti-sigma-YlaC factor YlaD